MGNVVRPSPLVRKTKVPEKLHLWVLILPEKDRKDDTTFVGCLTQC